MTGHADISRRALRRYLFFIFYFIDLLIYSLFDGLIDLQRCHYFDEADAAFAMRLLSCRALRLIFIFADALCHYAMMAFRHFATPLRFFCLLLDAMLFDTPDASLLPPPCHALLMP